MPPKDCYPVANTSTGGAAASLGLCDNESFLKADAVARAHASKHIELLHIPARSPDLNPVERFWGWLRKRLRAMDLADLKEGRKPIKKTALKERVRRLVSSVRAKATAKNHFFSLHKTCRLVRARRGAATPA